MLTDSEIRIVCDKMESEKTTWAPACRELVINIGFELDVDSKAFENAVKGATMHFLRHHRAEVESSELALQLASGPHRADYATELHRWFVLVLAFGVRNTKGEEAMRHIARNTHSMILSHVKEQMHASEHITDWKFQVGDVAHGPDVVLRCLAVALTKHHAHVV